MIWLYLTIAFVAGFFFAIGSGAFISYLTLYERNRKRNKNHR